MDRQDGTPGPLPRKKIWEIDECFKCALIGTCLSRGELGRLGKEKIYAALPGTDDYLLHSHFIAIAGRQDRQSKALHKYLEKKYRAATRKYFLVATDEEVGKLWAEDLAEGRIDSAWWAVMTHPLASMELVVRLYREVHMLSHEYLGGHHRKKQLIDDLRSQVAGLKEVLDHERQSYLLKRCQLKEEIAELAIARDSQAVIIRQNHSLQAEIAGLRNQLADLAARRREETEQQSSEPLRRENSKLKFRVAMQTAELETLKERHLGLEQRAKDQAAEIAALEGMLIRHPPPQPPCATCADQNTANCPGLNLCGRTVLYVGGLHKMVPHYRQLVENSGGRFMHHDGGREASRNLLPKMLITADAVFCPIDCISHDACNCVKKMCKRYRKPFVLMRSASLSSLAKGLTNIVQ